MSQTGKVVLVDGDPIGYLPPTDAYNVDYKNNKSVGEGLDELNAEMATESVTLTRQSSSIDTNTLYAKSKAGNLHFFGYFHTTASIASGTVIYTLADHRPSVAQNVIAMSTSNDTAVVTVYEDGRVYVASTMATAGFWVLVGEIWE